MTRMVPFLAASLALASPAAASDTEPLCSDCFSATSAREMQPLRIEIENGLQFSRLACAATMGKPRSTR
jgi:hypothetical protein